MNQNFPTRTLSFQSGDVALTADAVGDDNLFPVVLLHGGGQTRHAWGSAAEALAQHGFYAISVDMRGHGHSEWSPEGDYRIDAFANDVRTICTDLAQRPILVGASLGGLSSLIAIGETREPIASGLVLVDVAPYVERKGTENIRAFMMQGADGFDRLEDAADAISAYLPNRPRPKSLEGLQKNLNQRDDGRWYWHWDPRFIRGPAGIDGQDGLVDHDRLTSAAHTITIPTLLLRGQLSDVVGDRSVEELRFLIPHAQVVNVPNAGHMIAGDRNDAFNRAVIEFVEAVAPNGRS